MARSIPSPDSQVRAAVGIDWRLLTSTDGSWRVRRQATLEGGLPVNGCLSMSWGSLDVQPFLPYNEPLIAELVHRPAIRFQFVHRFNRGRVRAEI